MKERYFSASYDQAKTRFLRAANRAGAQCLSYQVCSKADPALTIDIAIVGSATAKKTLIVTSGIHGVEGFFGSAVQLAWLKGVVNDPLADGLRVVLVHAINPYGFRHSRRFNEGNVDLNRNFPELKNTYSGAPAGYALHNSFLNPEKMPSKLEVFKLKAAWKIWRHGMAALKESIASGQYQYPSGLFFGGYGPEESTNVVVNHLESWLGQSSQVFHIDLHSGLGEYGRYKLLLNEPAGTERYQWFEQLFGSEAIEALGETGGTAYPVNGIFGAWCQQQAQGLDYRFVGVEFGTYNVVRVLKALREENCAHRFEDRTSRRYRAAKQELLACFCPADIEWRRGVVDASLGIIKTACRVE